MKILYDGAIYAAQNTGGVNRYFANIISRLPASFEPALTTFDIRSHQWPNHPNLQVYKAPSFPPRLLARRLGRYYFRSLAERLNPDIVHPTYHVSLDKRRLNSYGCPSVITVYDFVHDIFAPVPEVQQREITAQAQAIADADAILCISHNTKRDLLTRFPTAESKIRVIHLASEIELSMAQGSEPIPQQPYFLFVGSRASYKNFDGLVRAFARIAVSNSAIRLAIVGAPLTSTEQELLSELKIAEHILTFGYVTDFHLAKLYHHSLAFVYPSFYEGFGIPLLEAMACETVVIAADNSSIPEVTGGAALLFDTGNNDELTDIMRAVEKGQVNRESLIAGSRTRAAQFSWERTSAQTVEVYRSLT